MSVSFLCNIKSCDVRCGSVGACSRSTVYDKTYKEIVTDTKLSDSSFMKLISASRHTHTVIHTVLHRGVHTYVCTGVSTGINMGFHVVSRCNSHVYTCISNSCSDVISSSL